MGRELHEIPYGRAALCVFTCPDGVPPILSSLSSRARTVTIIESTLALCDFNDWPHVLQQKCDNPLVTGRYELVTDHDVSSLIALANPKLLEHCSVHIHDGDHATVDKLESGMSLTLCIERQADAWVVVEETQGIV
jgi:hypothetical protein